MRDRYGVVNELDRAEYEKKWQIPYGYNYISFDMEDAIKECDILKETKRPRRYLLGPNKNGWIVERIYSEHDLRGGYTKREVVYRV